MMDSFRILLLFFKPPPPRSGLCHRLRRAGTPQVSSIDSFVNPDVRSVRSYFIRLTRPVTGSRFHPLCFSPQRLMEPPGPVLELLGADENHGICGVIFVGIVPTPEQKTQLQDYSRKFKVRRRGTIGSVSFLCQLPNVTGNTIRLVQTDGRFSAKQLPSSIV